MLDGNAFASQERPCPNPRRHDPTAGQLPGHTPERFAGTRPFANQLVGIQEVSERIWLVSFMEFDLGYFDEDAARVEPAENPFSPKVLPM